MSSKFQKDVFQTIYASYEIEISVEFTSKQTEG